MEQGSMIIKVPLINCWLVMLVRPCHCACVSTVALWSVRR
jgi:hypothetical protein